jgi:hypothetical protein
MSGKKPNLASFKFSVEDFILEKRRGIFLGIRKWKNYSFDMANRYDFGELFNKSLGYEVRFELTVFHKIKLADKINDLNEHLDWINKDTKKILIDLFKRFSGIRLEYANHWFELLDLDSIEIEIGEDGIIYSVMRGDDNIGREHGEGWNVFTIRSKGKQIVSLASAGFGDAGRIIVFDESSGYHIAKEYKWVYS